MRPLASLSSYTNASVPVLFPKIIIQVAAGTEHFVFFDMPTTNSPPSSANENEGFRSMQVEVSWSISSSKPALGFGVAIVCRQVRFEKGFIS